MSTSASAPSFILFSILSKMKNEDKNELIRIEHNKKQAKDMRTNVFLLISYRAII